MNDKNKEKFARRLKSMLDACVPRKKAMLIIRDEIAAIDPDLPRGRSTILGWCKKFGVSTR